MTGGTLTKLNALLTPRERRRGMSVLALVVVMAGFEVLGVASVLPFFIVLSDPALVDSQPMLQRLFALGGFDSSNSFLLALALVTFAFLITAALIRSAGEYAMTRFVQMRRHSLGTRLLTRYLRQPYAFFLGRHTGEMSKNILSEVEQVTMFALAPVMRFAMASVTLAAILVFLMVMDPAIAIGAILVLGAAYLGIFATIRKIVTRNSARRVAADQARYTIAREALGGIKDVRILGKEDSYLSHFRIPSIEVSRMQAANQVLGQLPKYLVEAVGFGGMLLLCVVLLTAQGAGASAGAILPKLGVYAFAGYRMLPSVQAIYRAMVEFRFGAGAVDVLYRDMTQLPDAPTGAAQVPPLPLRSALSLQNVGFKYDAKGQGVKALTLSIPAGSSVGIVGGTGAGKTTFVDLVLGLLTPDQGEILIDGVPVTDDNLRRWQSSIGYVPQSIFLGDMSIAENIALGVAKPDIDMDRIRDCARLAQLDQFVENRLSDGYDTVIGESGVRLSGGQRQRIGIARALYRDPDILVFDEATSALDTVTERDVMKAINALSGKKTILMIAHRISTVEACDKIILLEQGQIKAQGKYADLLSDRAEFRALAGEAS